MSALVGKHHRSECGGTGVVTYRSETHTWQARCPGCRECKVVEVGVPPRDPHDTTRTRTLRGMGPTPPTAYACPACHVKADDTVHRIDSAIAVAFGIALVYVRGVEAAREALCDRHKAIVRTLVNEIRSGASQKT